MSAAPRDRGGRQLALVPGGCRRLGAAIALALARAGYDLAVHGGAGSEPESDLLAAIARAGVSSAHFVADLRDPSAVADLLPAVERHFGCAPVLLVNNAARFDYDSPETATHAGLIEHYAVNTVAPVLLARALAARAGPDRPAVVVNILDQRIAEPNGDQFSYTLSKLALSEATAILARQFAPYVRVSAVAPGPTLPTPDYADDHWAAVAACLPLERLPDPAEIADAVVFLARSRAVTGQTLFVDGGAHLHRYARDFLFLDGTASAKKA